MDFPVLYEVIIIASIALFCFFVTLLSGAFYNTLVKKELLDDTRECVPFEKRDYLFLALCGIAVGALFSLTELVPVLLFNILMLPALFSAVICDVKNGFIPTVSTVLLLFCGILKTLYLCINEGTLSYVLSSVSGFCVIFLLMLFIGFLSEKVLKRKGSGKNEIFFVSALSFTAGLVPAMFIFAAASLLSIATYIIPVKIMKKRAGTPVLFRDVSYPLSPYFAGCFIIAAVLGLTV